MDNIAIVVVAYNRTDSLKRLLGSLEGVDYMGRPTDLIISVDKSANDVVERFAEDVKWNHGMKRLAFHKENLGLKKHVLSIGGYLEEYDAVVVLEDDLTVSTNLMRYAIETVARYKDNPVIAGISLYSFNVNYQTNLPFIPLASDSDVYFMNCAMSWGQIWMRQSWRDFYAWYQNNSSPFSDLPNIPSSINNWNDKSWLKYHTRYCIENDKFFVYPYNSITTNNADAGIHVSSRNSLFQVPVSNIKKEGFKLIDPGEDAVRYDGFFEALHVFHFLPEYGNNLGVNLYGQKKAIDKRFILTSESLPYKIVRSYGIAYKPIEMNVLMGMEGKDLFLYDTSEAGPAPKPMDRKTAFDYWFGDAFRQYFRIFGKLRGYIFVIGYSVKRLFSR